MDEYYRTDRIGGRRDIANISYTLESGNGRSI